MPEAKTIHINAYLGQANRYGSANEEDLKKFRENFAKWLVEKGYVLLGPITFELTPMAEHND